MPELGNRGNVMGPQPIGRPKPVAPEMIAAAEMMLKLIADGNRAELEAMAMPSARDSVASLARSARPGAYSASEIISQARVNAHYFVKAKLSGRDVEPLLLQVRLGEQDGRWMIWEAVNLTGRRSAWTR
jgi:hypothetical protein